MYAIYGILKEELKVKKTAEFDNWYAALRIKEQAQIDARLHRIEHYDHFGDAKDLSRGLAELRWANGRRIYFTRIFDNGTAILLVLGGLKNAQKKDIKQARLLVQKYTDERA